MHVYSVHIRCSVGRLTIWLLVRSADNLCTQFWLRISTTNVGPDMDSTRLTIWRYSWKRNPFLWITLYWKNQQTIKCMQNFPACKELRVNWYDFLWFSFAYHFCLLGKFSCILSFQNQLHTVNQFLSRSGPIFFGPDLIQNCLQSTSADDTGRQELRRSVGCQQKQCHIDVANT